MKNNVPILALLIGYAGAITNVLTEAKSVIGLFAAIASLVASIYAIAISHQRLKAMTRNPFAPGLQPSRLRRKSLRHPLRRGQSGSHRLKKIRRLSPRSLVLITLIACAMATGCSHVSTTRARADKALTQSNEALTEQSRALTTGIVDTLGTIPDAGPGSTHR